MIQNPQSGLDLLDGPAPQRQAKPSGLDLLDEPKKSLGVGGRIQEGAHYLLEGAKTGAQAAAKVSGMAEGGISRALYDWLTPEYPRGHEQDVHIAPVVQTMSDLHSEIIGKSVSAIQPAAPEGSDPHGMAAAVEEGIGNIPAYIGAGALGGVIGGPPGALAATALLSGVQAAVAEGEKARAMGANQAQASAVALLNFPGGAALGAIGPGGKVGGAAGRMMERFGASKLGRLADSFLRIDKETGGELGARIAQLGKAIHAGDAAKSVGVAVGAMEAQNGISNLIAAHTYDKDRSLWENWQKVIAPAVGMGLVGHYTGKAIDRLLGGQEQASAQEGTQEPAQATQTEKAPEVNLPVERTAAGLPEADRPGVASFLEQNRPDHAKPKEGADPYAEPDPLTTSYNETIGAGKGLAEEVKPEEHPLIGKINESGARVVRVETGHEDPPMPAAYDPETKTIYIASENKDPWGSLVYETFGRHLRERDPSLWEDLRRAVEEAAPERMAANAGEFRADSEAAGIPIDTAAGTRGPGVGRTVQEARPVIEAILKAAAKSQKPQTLLQRFFKSLSGWLDSMGLGSRKWLKATREDQALLASYPPDAQMQPSAAIKIANKALEILEKAAESQERVKPDKGALLAGAAERQQAEGFMATKAGEIRTEAKKSMLAGEATREAMRRTSPEARPQLPERVPIPLPSENASGKIRLVAEQATSKPGEQPAPVQTGQMTPEGESIQQGAKRFDIEESPAGSSNPNRRILPDVRRKTGKPEDRGIPVEGVTTREGNLARKALQQGVGRTSIGRDPYETVNPASTPEGKARGLAGREVYRERHSPLNLKATVQEAEKRLAEGGAAYARELLDKSKRNEPLDFVEQAALGIAEGRANDAAPIFDDTSSMSRVASDLTWEWNKQGESPARQLILRRQLGGNTTKSVKSTIASLYRSASDATMAGRKRIEKQLLKATTPEKRAELKAQLKEIEAKEKVRREKLKEKLISKFGSEGDMIRAAEANLVDMGHALNLISQSRAGLKNKFREWLYISMMSAPPTHINNFVGNAVNVSYNGVVNKWVQALVGSVKGDLDAASIPEAMAYTRTLLSSVRDGGKHYWDSMRSDIGTWEEYLQRNGVKHPELGIQGDKAHHSAIGGLAAAAFRKISTTEMMAMDQAFKVILTKAQVHSLAFRRAKADGLKPGTPEFDAAVLEVQGNYADPIWAEAFDHAQRITYNAHDSALSDAVLGLRTRVDDLTPLPLGTMLVTFVRVGEAVFKTGLEPVYKPFETMYKFARDATSKSYAYDKQQQAMDVAKSILGIGLMAVVYENYWDDKNGLPLLTGSRERGGKGQLQARTIPAHMMSLDGGKTYHSVWWTGPGGIFLTMFADFRDAVKDNPAGNSDVVAGSKAALTSLVKSMGDQTYMKNLGDIFKASEAGDESPYAVATIAQGLMTEPIPALFRTSMRAADPWVRKSTVRTHEDKTALESAFTPEALLYQAVPLPSNAPPIKYDRWGRPMRKDSLDSGVMRILNIAPANEQAASIHKLDMLINKYNDRVNAGELGKTAIPYNPVAPNIAYKVRGDDRYHYWSDEEYATLTREAGSRAASVLSGMALNYDAPTPRDIDAMERVYSREVSMVKNELLAAQRQATQAR